jgi:hypothetical protein
MLFDKSFRQCPLSVLDADASEVLQMIQMSEGGGFGSSRVSPSQLLSETQYYWNVRVIVMEEQRRIEKIRKAREKAKARNKHG